MVEFLIFIDVLCLVFFLLLFIEMILLFDKVGVFDGFKNKKKVGKIYMREIDYVYFVGLVKVLERYKFVVM